MADSLLVGSVAGDDSEQVFRTAAGALAGSLRRLPDGETGERCNWIGFQIGRLVAADGIEMGEPRQNPAYPPFPQVRLTRPAAEIELGDLGYATAAIASWETFQRLREEGTIGAAVRFQVSLPTPLAVVDAWVALDDQHAFEPVYERALLAELEAICAAIPHEELALQWDVAAEVAILEGAFLSALPAETAFADIADRLARLGEAVPADVELGYHLCYGDLGHEHFKQPESLALAVRIANRVAADVGRPIGWFHMPVPVGRHDDAYFAPLGDLRLDAGPQLYLGLIHDDGPDGTQARVAAARRALADRSFGVATECGLGRIPREQVEPLLALHRDARTA